MTRRSLSSCIIPRRKTLRARRVNVSLEHVRIRKYESLSILYSPGFLLSTPPGVSTLCMPLFGARSLSGDNFYRMSY